MTALDKLIEAVEAGTFPADVTAAECGLNGVGIMQLYAAFNGSLDAALALHEAMLPGWQWQVFQIVGGKYVAVLDGLAYSTPEMTAATPARAWLLAILRAYRSVQA